MIAQENVIQKLNEQSKQLVEQLELLSGNMADAQAQYVEQIDRLLVEREDTLREMKHLYRQGQVECSEDQHAMIEQLKVWEPYINEKIAQLYLRFALQMSK